MAKRQKRPHGAGTFFRRADGYFVGKVLVGYSNGQPKYTAVVRLHKLSPQHVQQLLRQLARDGYAATTVDRARDILINALNQAVQWQLVARNVAALTAPPKVEAYEPRVLTPTEAQRLLATATGDRLEALWRIGLSGGLRRGEALGLCWQDVDLDSGTLKVTVNLQEIDGKLVLVKPKTKESQRVLPLPASLVVALRQHKVRQLQEKLLAGSQWKEHGLVFCTSVGTPIRPRNMLRSLRALLDRADLPRMRFHDLRHSCGTLLIVQGAPLNVVQEILGHSDIRTTRMYTHMLSEQKRQATALMDQLFGDVQDGIGHK